MTTQLNPYLSFRDNAKQAMEFYQSVFGGEVTSSTFAEFPEQMDAAENDKIMHSTLTSSRGLVLMAADTPRSMGEPSPNGSLSVSGEDETELRGYWDKLSASGTVSMPLEKAPWGDSFGMCVDGFGVRWMFNIAGESASE
ncbi:VOC family protein [Glaciibacter psychrotolerans]|uniref:PhnB protein n=1 Tax=Glaciibacter psychrotolerans TaxID=670054 RepID=A0A7Z0EB55_9MICO|nr:VOC family protein [Leifsonia psychrotolerans]NYJ18313.1 PhnB protein [Leifsonia psychrotolerans]